MLVDRLTACFETHSQQERPPSPPEVEQANQGLESEDPAAREAAVSLFGLWGGDAAKHQLSAITKLLHSDSSLVVRQACAAALGDLHAEGESNALVQALSDEDPMVAFEAAYALAKLKHPAALTPLLSALDHKVVRLEALDGLAHLGLEAAIPPITKLSERQLLPWPDQLTAWATLYRLGEKRFSEKLISRFQAFNGAARQLAMALSGHHQIVEAIEPLVRIVLKGRSRDRSFAVEALAQLRAEDALDALLTEDLGPALLEHIESALNQLREQGSQAA